MTRSPDEGGSDLPTTDDPPRERSATLVVTLAMDGPQGTVLDVVAAGTVGVLGAEEAVRGLLERAAALVADTAGASPVVVLLGPATAGREPPAIERLVEAIAPGDGTAIPVGGACPRCREAVELTTLGPAATVVAVEPVLAPGTTATPGPGRPGEAVTVAEGAARVDLLGPVSVHGAAAGLAGHPKLTELAVYLALHDGGAPSRVWAEALWPERAVPPQTIANRLSELRRLLGFAQDGRPRLRRDGDRHRLVEVQTDWESARRLASPGGSLDGWCRALALVRGRPFTGLRDAGWTQFEGHVAEIERTLTDCALRASAALLEASRPDEAAWAAEQGLRAVPWDERLHRALMRAGAAAGNLGRVEETLRHLALALELDGDPLVQVHPETARLYRELSGRGR